MNIIIRQELCKKCGICISFCPQEVLTLGYGGWPEVKDVDNCTGCALCVMRCPDFALELEGLVIDGQNS